MQHTHRFCTPHALAWALLRRPSYVFGKCLGKCLEERNFPNVDRHCMAATSTRANGYLLGHSSVGPYNIIDQVLMRTLPPSHTEKRRATMSAYNVRDWIHI